MSRFEEAARPKIARFADIERPCLFWTLRSLPVNAISKTAFICCGIRAADAKSPGPICADIYAEDFMTEEGRSIWQRFAGSPRGTAINVARARMVQDEIGRHLKRNKDLQVVNIGAGFDSRAYRLAGGRWFEFDEPAIIEHKNDRLPTDLCPKSVATHCC